MQLIIFAIPPGQYLSMHSNLLRIQFECHDLCTLRYISRSHSKYIFKPNSISCHLAIESIGLFGDIYSNIGFIFQILRHMVYMCIYIHIYCTLKRKFPQGYFLDKTSNLICPSSKIMFVLDNLKIMVNRYHSKLYRFVSQFHRSNLK